MKRIILPCAVLITTLAFAVPAQAALLTRTFVSAAGSDANPCTITAPCATFAHAYSLTAPSGIIAALDPGKYGPMTITGPITINGNGWAAITAPASSTAIAINAGGSDSIILTGLEIDGAGAGNDGIFMTGGSRLEVIGCVVRNFTGVGIEIFPTSAVNFLIQDTVVFHNEIVGIDIAPEGSGNVDGVVSRTAMDGNGTGFALAGEGSAGTVSVVDSIAANNLNVGFEVNNGNPPNIVLALRNVTATANTTGVQAELAGGGGPVTVRIAHSLITGNNTGVVQNSSTVVASYGDNDINGNTTDVTGTLSPVSQR